MPQDAGIARHHTTAPVEVHRFQHGDRIALRVGSADVDRVAMFIDVRPWHRLIHLDTAGPLVEIGLG
ncbi:hypothetical protein D3C81_1723830 [compost metagenome]